MLTGLGAAALLAGGGWAGATPVAAVGGDPYGMARAVWRGMLTGGSADPSDPRVAAAIRLLDDEARTWRGLLDQSSGRRRVFTDLSFASEASLTDSYLRLRTMATALVTPGSVLHGDPQVLAEVLAGLRTTHDEIYHAGQGEFGNWWHWEIGATRALGDVCVLIYDHLPADALAAYLAAIDHFVPDPYYQFLDPARRTLSAGANRVDLCRAVAVRGILGCDDAKISRARDGVSDVFAYVAAGNGFYRDGSFVQHSTVAYTGTYGVVLLDGTSRLITLLADSPWEISDPDRQILFDAVDIGYTPVVYDDQMMDFVRGRAISRAEQPDHYHAHLAAEHILRLADGVESHAPRTAARWRGVCKGWLERDTYHDLFSDADVPRAMAYAGLLSDTSVEAAPESTGFTMFAGMDRALHRRTGWAYAIAMASKRIAYYECGNGENDKGFHTGEGMTYLYNADNGQFADDFWPTVDLYRLPGTTIDSAPLPDRAGGEWGAARPPSATWVGGASLHAEHGAVGMHLQGIGSSLTARKSWFCLGDLIVALGAGIAGGGELPVETVVENRNLHADGRNALLLDGERQPDRLGWSALRKTRWAHLEGVGGYVFPRGERVHVLREERTGSWSDIHTAGPTDPVTRRYLTMWFDHGIRPQDASYAYVLAPNASPERTRRLAEAGRRDVQILDNTAELQAVRAPGLGLTGVNFWGGGEAAGETVPSAGDTYVSDGRHADTNYGSVTRLLVKHVQAADSGYTRQAYLVFDPASAAMEPEEIAAATLWFRARVNDSRGSEIDLDLHTVSDWQEDTLTWNTRPAQGQRVAAVHVDGAWQWRSVDLTEHVRTRLSEGRRLSLLLMQNLADRDGLSVEIASREDAHFGPYLRLEAAAERSETAGITADAPCSVLVREDGGSLTLAVADATQELGSVRVTVAAPGYRSWHGDQTVRVDELGPPIRVTVHTEGSLGATHTVTFTR